MSDFSRSIAADKSFAFAQRVVKCYRYVCESKKEFVLSKQLLRSGTSIGANIEEALGGHTRKDFHNKISIAYKEARETDYWLRLLYSCDYLDLVQFSSMRSDCLEIIKILSRIRQSLRDDN